MDNNIIHNPLNVRTSTQRFVGEIQPSPHEGFKAFQSFAYGLRAGSRILATYYRQYGLNTIKEIISRWAPPSDGNDTDNYIAFVANRMGIGSYESFKVIDPNELMLLVDAIGHKENPVQYTPDDLEKGVKMALNIDV